MKAEKNRKNELKKQAFSLTASALTALVKLIAGAVTASVFVVLSGFYSVGMGTAKALCYSGGKTEGDYGRISFYFAVSGTLFVAAILYLAGAVRQFFVPATFGFGLIPAIAVAAVAFYDLFSAIIGLIKAVKEKKGFYVVMRSINLSGAFSALALTQVALLSVNSEGGNNFANAAMAVIAGAVTLVSAAATAVRGVKERRKAQEDNMARAYREESRLKNK